MVSNSSIHLLAGFPNCVLFNVQMEDIPELTAESTMDDLWSAQMASFSRNAGATLKFAKKIPG